MGEEAFIQQCVEFLPGTRRCSRHTTVCIPRHTTHSTPYNTRGKGGRGEGGGGGVCVRRDGRGAAICFPSHALPCQVLHIDYLYPVLLIQQSNYIWIFFLFPSFYFSSMVCLHHWVSLGSQSLWSYYLEMFSYNSSRDLTHNSASFIFLKTYKLLVNCVKEKLLKAITTCDSLPA